MFFFINYNNANAGAEVSKTIVGKNVVDSFITQNILSFQVGNIDGFAAIVQINIAVRIGDDEFFFQCIITNTANTNITQPVYFAQPLYFVIRNANRE